MTSGKRIQWRSIWILIGLGAFSWSIGASGLAEAATAQACAGKLSPEARTIYDAAAPGVTPTIDLVSLLKSTVPGLVFEGSVPAQPRGILPLRLILASRT